MLTSTDFTGLFNQRFFTNFLPIPATNQILLGCKPPDFILPDITNNQMVRLGNYFEKQPVILAFTRIFTEKQYCPFCYPHIVNLNKYYERFVERGVEILMITSTDAQQSETVVRDLGLKMPLLSNPDCQVFRRYHTGQALGAPLPAQFILDKTGKIQYKHLFSFIDHNATVDQLLLKIS